MRIFLDANVLVSIVNQEYPSFHYCARIASLADKPGFTVFTSSLSLGITWYFACKKHGQTIARKKLEILMAHISVTDCGQKEIYAALKLKKADDFEDAMQYFSAFHAGCEFIITSNQSDFYFSEIKVVSPEEFFNDL
jgi:predicted nucleic acid-binding protein